VTFKLSKPLDVVFKDQSPKESLSSRRAKKCIVLVFGNIRTPDFSEFNLSPICRSFACQFPGR
jgi:hypothetical protein